MEPSGASSVWSKPRVTQESHRRHAGCTQEAPRRHPGGTQEAPRRHPEGTQRHPAGTQRSREVFEGKCVESIKIYCKNLRERMFCMEGSDVALTVPATCAQK